MSFSLYSVQNASELGLDKEISDVQYITYALACHLLIVVTAAIVDDVAILFDFISAFGITLLMYILPAVFYLSTSKKFARKAKQSSCFENRIYEYISYFMVVFGFFALGLGFRVCWYNMTKN